MERNMEPLKPLGPLMDADAEFIKAIIRLTNPLIVMEFGHLFGDSAKSMLSVLPKEAKLYSYDKDNGPYVKNDPRFIFHKISQEAFEPINDVDFVFLDASHDLELNKQTFEKLIGCMNEKGIIAVHDTGTWPWNAYNFDKGQETSNGRYAHCPNEIHFVNWLLDTHPDWQVIHFHGDRNQVRHGITLLQKKTRLSL